MLCKASLDLKSFRFTKHMEDLTICPQLTPGNNFHHMILNPLFSIVVNNLYIYIHMYVCMFVGGCSFNQLDLPEYPSKEHLEERLLLAIHEANEGFGFG